MSDMTESRLAGRWAPAASNARVFWIYVPLADVWADGSSAVSRIVRGSGIVSAARGSSTGLVVIDFEGGIYRPSNVRTWADRVMIAVGRHQVRYPTVARMTVEGPLSAQREVQTVAELDVQTRRIEVINEGALRRWLDVPDDESYAAELVLSAEYRRRS